MAHPVSEHDDIDTRIFAEQIAMVYQLTPHTLAMSMIGSTLILFALWSLAPPALLLSWYVLHHLVTLLRYLLIRSYRRARPVPAAAPLRARRFVIGTSAAGLIGRTVFGSGALALRNRCAPTLVQHARISMRLPGVRMRNDPLLRKERRVIAHSAG
ncbi:MAG TPA: hypothetical protein PLR37_08805 [Candidatus Accumulibacter phosphatis]|uniref:hypothetical protein n=1 Tax=Accumulibacter sp. TaxID=2053492 RepID=UPI001A5711F5|nr:hypothetical protein [Accumulibacter sp.]MBL8406240.1 hypothetical protein [Accumulibacter sp.]HRF12216.1 hypothetical protein [Candidatus Accumulibacter phosphatis]